MARSECLLGERVIRHISASSKKGSTRESTLWARPPAILLLLSSSGSAVLKKRGCEENASSTKKGKKTSFWEIDTLIESRFDGGTQVESWRYWLGGLGKGGIGGFSWMYCYWLWRLWNRFLIRYYYFFLDNGMCIVVSNILCVLGFVKLFYFNF